MNALEVFTGSDGDLTMKYYRELSDRGILGQVAVCLFRAQKCSVRAKKYRGGNSKGRYRDMAYDRKSWSMGQLCAILAQHGASLEIRYGWKQDPNTVFGERPSWVLYVDVPGIGQISFHSPTRGQGPAYEGEWDGQRGVAEQRVIAFCDRVFAACAVGA